MPTYEYECQSCGDSFDHMQSMSSPVLRKCKTCGKHKLARLISGGGGIIFKGEGFHSTDYRSPRYSIDRQRERVPKDKR